MQKIKQWVLAGWAVVFSLILLTGCAGADVGSGTGAGAGTGSGTGTPSASKADASFVAIAGSNGLLQVQLSELAMQKSANLEVREFAKLMAQQHTRINTELKGVAQQMRVTYPGALSGNDKVIYDRTAKLSSPVFEQTYAREMETALQQDIALYQNAVSSSSNLALRGFALKNTPVLQGYLRLATQLKKVVP
ncbi:DUF4142 domain-containing protein [Rufibacter ruber]|uniref:DUF4142 domain-containing protein n=1 Tax=Rufibacter ruber TaxID=1783499 RepID=UPI00137B5325|nr:DUF4142 domain-containing protein [Rufibacter ruber]